MRFFSVVAALMVGSAMAAPAQVNQRNVLGEVNDIVNEAENGLGVGQIEQKLDEVMGGSLQKIEGALPINLVDKLKSLMASGKSSSIVQAVGQCLNLVDHGVAITTVDSYLNALTAGELTSLDSALGLDHVENFLNL